MPHVETLPAFELLGLSCRTSNAAEMDRQHPERARIGRLWQDFAGSGLQGEVFGAYFDYTDRHHADYRVLAGIRAPLSDEEITSNAGATTDRRLQVPAGRYLVFEAQGTLPEALIQTWSEVWAYFEQPGAPARAYNVDLERYLGPGHVQICIGLKDGPQRT